MVDIVDSVNNVICKDASLIQSELVNGNRETWRLALISILECEKQAEQYEQGSKPGSQAYAVWADIVANTKKAASILHQAISGDEKTLTRAQMSRLMGLQMLAHYAHSNPLGIPGLEVLSGVLLQALNSFMPPLESNSTLCLSSELVNGNQET
ncbi:MAG: hypothetical protein KGQ49_06090, partial [Verrucomicrobia bacterium]|nr:hypothetical protein [Verrucomicrobiota bacterium]